MAKDGKTKHSREDLIEEVGRLKEENSTLRNDRAGLFVSRTLRELFKWGGIVGAIYLVKDMVVPFAGKETVTDVRLKAENSIEVSVEAGDKVLKFLEGLDCDLGILAIGLIFGFGGILYGRLRDREKSDFLRLYYPFKREAETRIDPNRTSSELTPDGKTRPEDH